MSPAWDTDTLHVPGTCAHCGHWTDDGIAHWIPRASGPEVEVIVCADLRACSPPPRAERPRRYPS